jgi:hypothetical protein
MLSAKLGKMDTTNQLAFNESGFSTNVTNSSTKKKEKLVARILATKIYTKPSRDPRAYEEVKLNTIMKGLIINRYVDEFHTRVVKRKQSKR